MRKTCLSPLPRLGPLVYRDGINPLNPSRPLGEQERSPERGSGEGGGDHDSGSDSGGGFGTEHTSRPRPARWPQTTNSQRRPWDRNRGADGDDASTSSGGKNHLAEGSDAVETKAQDRRCH